MTGIWKGLFTIVSLLSAVLIHGQQPHYVLNSDASGSSMIYKAWDFISLKPGFHYNSPQGSGNSFLASIQAGPPTLPTSNTYMTEEGVITSDPVLGGVVGTIPGHVDVSDLGAATYTIPIEVPTGMRGMTPSVSFTYNSNGGDGTMGIGWSLSGLSKIYRSGSTLFKNVKPEPLSTWINDSIFYLDGMKLIPKNKIHPPVKYGQTNIDGGLSQIEIWYEVSRWENFETEYESNTMISTFGYIPFVSISGIYFSASCATPRTFIVKSKDGSISAYKAAKDSLYITSGDNINIEWLLSYKSDPQGNFIRYNYQTIGKQTVIKSIEYTGNNFKEPFDSIVFIYDKKETIDRYYVSDAALENRLLLKSVKAFSNNNVIRQYDIDYSKVGAKYYLQSVSLKGLDNTHFRKSIFSWGTNYDDLSTQTLSIPDVNSSYPVPNNSRSWYAADINGDGLDDVVNIYPTQVLENGVLLDKDRVQVFKSTQTSGNIALTSEAFYDLGGVTGDFSGAPDSKVLFGDINGDGKVEMLFPNVNVSTLTLTVTAMGIGSFTRTLSFADPRPLFGIGDFNKDGKDDFIYLESVVSG